MRSDVVEELFKEHYNSAILYTLSLCKNPAVAEDVVSDAFYKALMTADDKIVNFRAWLLTVCRNGYYDLLRKKKRLVSLSDTVSDGKESLLDSVIKDEGYKALYNAIYLLPENYREIIVLFYFERQKLPDIAKIVGKSENNVKVTLLRAMEKLKTILENSHEF